MLTKILDHASRAVARLAAQFQASPLIKGLVTAFSNEIQNAEDGLYGLLAVRDIDAATAVTLDKVGSLVGAPNRALQTDANYRVRIRAQIETNKSNGDFEAIYSIAKKIVTAWNVAGQPKVIEAPIASYTIGCTPVGSIINTDAEARELGRVLGGGDSAGVRGIVLSQTISAANAFSFATGPGLGFGAGAFVAAYDGKQ